MAWLEPSLETIIDGYRGPIYVRYRIAGKQERSGPWRTLREAKEDLKIKNKEEVDDRALRRGKAKGDAAAIPLLERYLAEGLASNRLRASTENQKRRAIRRFVGRFRVIGQITKAEIAAWQTEMLTEPTERSRKAAERLADPSLRRPYSSTTASINLRALHTFLKWCVAQDILPHDPMQRMKIPKSKKRRDRAQSKADIEAIIAAATTPKIRLFFTMLFFQGLRKGMTLKVEGPEIRNGMWTIPGFKAKVERDITVPLHPRVRTAIAEAFPKGLPRGYLFEGFTERYIYMRWQEALKAAGITYALTIHGARRTWATQFITKTQNLKAMMEAGHWKDVATAMDYVHLANEWLKKQVETFDYDDPANPTNPPNSAN